MNSYYGYYWDDAITGWVKVNQFFFGNNAEEAITKLRIAYPNHSSYDVALYSKATLAKSPLYRFDK